MVKNDIILVCSCNYLLIYRSQLYIYIYICFKNNFILFSLSPILIAHLTLCMVCSAFKISFCLGKYFFKWFLKLILKI